MTASRFAAAFAFALLLAAPAQAGTSLVVDASTGSVLSSENAGQPWHPASTTKMMTAYLALKAVREGRLGLETAIPASKLAASQPRVKAYIKAGQEVTLDNALRIMMVKSANDIAYVIAEGVGGDVPSFVAMMNAEAQRLGMRDTVFTNPNGWHDPNQQVSARDLAVLAMALMRDFPDYADYWNTAAVQLGKTVMNNTNGLVGRYSGISGMKTGFVCASGFNVVATATRGGRTLIAVVLGATSGAERTVKAAQLLDDGFAQWGGSGATLASIPSMGGQARSVCDDVRRRGGGAPMADDADVSGPISHVVSGVGGNGEGTDDRFAAVAPQARAAAVASRSPSGRIVLGPRAEVQPIAVAFGRTPGSDRAPLAANAINRGNTMVAGERPAISPSAPVSASIMGNNRTISGSGATPRSTSAFAPSGPAASDGSGPMALQGAVRPGTATATSLRPGAAAGIKPPAKPARPVAAKPASRKPEPGKPEPAKTKAKSTAPAEAQLRPPVRPAPREAGN